MEDRREDAWLPTSPLRAGLTARDLRERERERRIHAHVSKHRERGASPRPRDRGLTREEIVDTAIAVADAEGVGAISMRRIARELGAGVMSLYWHVASKEELQDLMLESLEAEIQMPEPSGDWQGGLRAVARSTRAALLRHQWAMEFSGFRPPSGPNDARNAERWFAALDGLGLDAMTTVMVMMTVGAYISGAVLREIQEMRLQRETEHAMADMTEAEIAAVRDEYAQRMQAYGQYPHLARFIDEHIDPDSPDTRDERFEFGLDCVLGGIAARLAAS